MGDVELDGWRAIQLGLALRPVPEADVARRAIQARPEDLSQGGSPGCEPRAVSIEPEPRRALELVAGERVEGKLPAVTGSVEVQNVEENLVIRGRAEGPPRLA